MMPTFPRSPLSFRTAGFPQYGWKAGCPGVAFPDRWRAEACSEHSLSNVRFAFALRALRGHNGCPALCRAADSIAHRLGGLLILRPRGPRSGPGCSVPVRHHLIGPSVPLAGTSRFHRTAAYTRCLRCAGAPRRPVSGSGLSLTIPSWHAVLSDPRGVQSSFTSRSPMSTWPSPWSKELGTPNNPAIRYTRGTISGLLWFAVATARHIARPPIRT
jgi:hypothetical protein